MTTTNGPKRSVVSLLAIVLLASLTAGTATAAEVGEADGSILVVAPHPDDDVITAAGITAGRDDVTIAFVTNGDNDGEAEGLIRQGEAVTAQGILGQDENDLIFFGYPDGYLSQVWSMDAPSVWTHPTGRTTTYASRGLGSTDWHDYRMGEHANYNKDAMLADMVALIDQRRPAHIFVTSSLDGTTDHETTFYLVDAALSAVASADTGYGAIVHETVVWHPDNSIWDSWPQNRDASQNVDSDVSHGASPSIETASGGAMAWNDREQFIIPFSWQDEGSGDNPKSQAIAAHASQGGLGDFIGRFVHRDEIFWASAYNYPELSISDAVATEGDTVDFTVSRTGARNVAVTVLATTYDGTASDPGDYTGESQWLTLAVGEDSTQFSVTTTDDSSSESTESFTVGLSHPSAHVTFADDGATGTIVDDDNAGVLVDPLNGVTLSEAGGLDTYAVSLATPPTSAVVIAIAPDGQLSADRTTLTFDASNWSAPQIVTIQAIDDAVAESDPHTGTITHTASSADSRYNSLPPSYLNATITENATIDGPSTAAAVPVQFSTDTGASSYSWRVTMGGSQVADGIDPQLTFTPAAGGDYVVEVTVTPSGSAPQVASHALKVLGDIEGTFMTDIVWLADNGITKGCNPPTNDRFCPDANVTRGQMAAFLVRALGLTDDGGGNTFTDDNGSLFEDAIAKLATAGITKGCNPPTNDRFCPDANVTRGQMAAFLHRAANLGG